MSLSMGEQSPDWGVEMKPQNSRGVCVLVTKNQLVIVKWWMLPWIASVDGTDDSAKKDEWQQNTASEETGWNRF